MFPIERIGVHTSDLTGEIYVGRINSKGNKWLEKRKATDEVVEAVRDSFVLHMAQTGTQYGYEWTRVDGKIVRLICSVLEPDEVKGENA